ncbi:2-C-methyl-D-erythritol 2,4-cyclodiphosphate synthase [Ezakiella coagulans]|uniref:2-C-methyl-D-erythritol 2,4-cyclodiphosphate synthase n=1 Tax=Ezakiella coagulans TaxID=46507 RepID=UPI002014EBF2|nr:2-C-methyl-D-erythritol 2,4-cyclodiphosphate synthase [Ezakiella coagulans]UQK60438.1 2-C-methyl-D-erythritol 2,4-cyclodiphosphate synthase [Ezakiella coagulans]
MRIGHGYDIHIFAEDRPLYIGGIKIRDNNGLLGHSDADVLIHAIMDSLLGAAGLRDIGYYFPDTDIKYKGVDSKVLLKEVMRMISDEGFKIVNIDATVVMEKPKLKDYIMPIREKLAEVMGISLSSINVKATTNEKQDSVGEGKAVEVFSVALIEEVL